MSERTVMLAFCAGLIPTAAFSVCVFALLHSWCMGLKRDRDELKRAFQELKARHALLAIEEAQVASEPARCDSGGSPQFQQSEEQVTGSGEDERQIERELIELRQEHRNLQAVLARDKRQIGRALSELKSAREAWLNSRRTLRDAIDQRNQAHSKS